MTRLADYMTKAELRQVENIKKQSEFMQMVLVEMLLDGRAMPLKVTMMFAEEKSRIAQELSYLKGIAETRARMKRGEKP